MYWNLKCKNCNLELRISVQETDLGQTVWVLCPRCQTRTKTDIGIVPEENACDIPELNDRIKALAEIIMSDAEINSIIDSIRDDGFGIMLTFSFCRVGPPKESSSPKVDRNGNVKAGTFSPEDVKSLKKFRIKL